VTGEELYSAWQIATECAGVEFESDDEVWSTVQICSELLGFPVTEYNLGVTRAVIKDWIKYGLVEHARKYFTDLGQRNTSKPGFRWVGGWELSKKWWKAYREGGSKWPKVNLETE
jgi:hypothetical protein